MPEVTNIEPTESEEILEPNARNVMLNIISQLSKGSDLQRVTLPTFILEPRSFLEKIADSLSHPDTFLDIHKLGSPEERMVAIAKYYLSSWHIRPKGVRKPYNPVLGEYFRCKYHYQNGTIGYYVAEQVSHHPPISAYMFISPDNNIFIQGEMRPKSKFYGNSAATHIDGFTKVNLLNHPKEEYTFNYPSIYVYGILFGKLTYELGDVGSIICKQSGLQCKTEFKTKGLFTGSYHTLAGKIKKESGDTLYDLSGKWTDKINIKPKSGTESVFFDVKSAKIHPPQTLPESELNQFESHRLWKLVTDNIKINNIDLATEEKLKIEQNQRDLSNHLMSTQSTHEPKFFKLTKTGYQFKLDLSSDPKTATYQFIDLVFPNQP